MFSQPASALTAFTNLYAFERQGKIYADAANSLIFARADAPELQQPMEDALSHEAISAHVLQVEQILLAEQAQWGQLIGEIKPSLSVGVQGLSDSTTSSEERSCCNPSS